MGIGGAERLIGQAAVACARAGYDVTLYTRRLELEFEMGDGRELVKTKIIGRWISPKVTFRLQLLTQVLWTLWVVFVLFVKRQKIDLFVSDLVPHAVLFTKRLFPRVNHVVYCHFPDQLLVRPESIGRFEWYRGPMDRMEVRALLAADQVMVNSNFTQDALLSIAPNMRPDALEVVYPGADESLNRVSLRQGAEKNVILHLSRFTAAKNHLLALEAFDLSIRNGTFSSEFELVLAGGYDGKVKDVKDTYARLKSEIEKRDIASRVHLLTNVSDQELEELWGRCVLLVYPPVNEHFGLVPIEAMMRGIPVVALNSGGPLETVDHGVTGMLCPPDHAAISDAMVEILTNEENARAMGAAGKERAERLFSLDAFNRGFVDQIERTLAVKN